jgi:hypothetical protein
MGATRRVWGMTVKLLWVAATCLALLACGQSKPPFTPRDLTPYLVEKCKTDYPRDKGLRKSCIAAVKSVPNWSTDPNAPKTIVDTCREQFPDNTTLQLTCVDRGMGDDVDAKIRKAERDAN